MIHIAADAVEGLRSGGEDDEVLVVDGGADREQAYDCFAQALDLPKHFGRNLDALLDCLRDLADQRSSPWTLVWRPGVDPRGLVDEITQARQADPGIVAVLDDLADEYPALTVVIADRPGSGAKE